MASVLKFEWWTDWMFLWNLTGRQRWTDAGLQVCRLILKKLSNIWKGGCKTSLRFCSQVKSIAVRTAVGFFQAKSPASVLLWRTLLSQFSLVSSIFILRPLFSCFMSISINAWLLYVFPVTFDRHVHVKNPIIACAWLHACSCMLLPGFLIPAPTGGGCS